MPCPLAVAQAVEPLHERQPSMCLVPLKDHFGRVIGVLQATSKGESHLQPTLGVTLEALDLPTFNEQDEEFLVMVAGRLASQLEAVEFHGRTGEGVLDLQAATARMQKEARDLQATLRELKQPDAGSRDDSGAVRGARPSSLASRSTSVTGASGSSRSLLATLASSTTTRPCSLTVAQPATSGETNNEAAKHTANAAVNDTACQPNSNAAKTMSNNGAADANTNTGIQGSCVATCLAQTTTKPACSFADSGLGSNNREVRRSTSESFLPAQVPSRPRSQLPYDAPAAPTPNGAPSRLPSVEQFSTSNPRVARSHLTTLKPPQHCAEWTLGGKPLPTSHSQRTCSPRVGLASAPAQRHRATTTGAAAAAWGGAAAAAACTAAASPAAGAGMSAGGTRTGARVASKRVGSEPRGVGTVSSGSGGRRRVTSSADMSETDALWEDLYSVLRIL